VGALAVLVVVLEGLLGFVVKVASFTSAVQERKKYQAFEMSTSPGRRVSLPLLFA
jgi:hypothetical protein